MLTSHSVLGLGTVDSVGETAKSPMGALMDALRNPVHAAILAAAYLIYFLTTSVDTAQKRSEAKLDVAAAALTALVKSDADRAQHEQFHDAIMRQICHGVNKPSDQWKCNQ